MSDRREYDVIFHKEVLKTDLKKTNPATKNTLLKAIYERIASRPRDFKKLTGHENVWRFRVGDYRIVYRIDDEDYSVRIIAVDVRSKIYDKADKRLTAS